MSASTRSGLLPEDKGRVVTAFLESFFARYVEYDFTADLEEQLDHISNNELAWRDLLRDFWRDFTAAVDEHQGRAHRRRCSMRSTRCWARICSRRGRTAPIRARVRSAATASCRCGWENSAASSAARTIPNAATPASLPPAAPAAARTAA